MTHERREDRGAVAHRRNGDRRQDERRAGPRSGPERRLRNRRRLQRGIAGLLLASATLGTGALRGLEKYGGTTHDAAAVPASTAEDADDEAPPPEERADLQLPVYLNEAVERAMDRFSGGGRVSFEEALVRGGPQLEAIRQTFAEEGVPPDLAYVALVESEFKPDAQSAARARGVWQFMPHTGKQYGLEQDFWVDERSDPAKSTRAAAQYLKYLHGLFDDWDLALAAYNVGEGNLRQAIRRAGTNDFWALSKSGALPRETRDYVPRIHAAILMAKDPGKFGIAVRPAQAVATEVTTVPEATDLRAVASCTGVDLAEVMDMNPALKRRATPLDRPFEIRVPAGLGDEVQRCVEELPAAERVAVQKHTVSAGQTIGGLAQRYNTRARDILELNKLRNPKRIAKGTELLIPKAGVLAD